VSLPHVLLGLLHAEPRTGYDLARTMEDELGAAWSAGVSQIYPALARLRRNGWVLLRTLGPRRGPPRLLYRVTAAGRRELARWLAAPPPPERRHDPLLVRLALLDALPAADRRRALSEIDAAVAAEVERWKSSPPPEGSRGFARRIAIEEREALRRLLAREIEPAIRSAGSGRRSAPRRRVEAPVRRRT
jgi:DNA-binding PadR family transcriptional regulator